ncbi:hypothetical protein [Streptomyces sp. NPDC047042]|uniref:hypothetical protein n=1 Tax=Streptomyces sp. NPDC047042 TaxID=3154807 RepID=UPI0033E9B67E
MKSNDLLARLAELDAAPRTEPTAAGIDREETLLRQILDDTQRPARSAGPTFRRPLMRRVGFTLAGALAVVGAFGAVTGGLPGTDGAGPLSSEELASWTGTPQGLDTAQGKGSGAADYCLDATQRMGTVTGTGTGTGTAPKVSNADIRGDVASMVITRSGDAAYCLAGSDGAAVAMTISPVGALPARGVALDTHGARGSGDEEFNYVVGTAGSDVKKVVVNDHGKTAQATLQGGRWTAWWPEGQPEGLLTGTLTVTFTDGSSHTVSAKSLTDRD